METEHSLRNVVILNKKGAMINAQKHNNFLIILLEYYNSFFILTLMATVVTEARMF
jgi:hypothetical protein